MKITHDIIKPYLEKGLVESNRHDTLPLTIYNYTRECQFEGKWDEVTLQCRGLIMDDHGVIVARGFNKFFNYEEVENLGEIPLTDEYVYVQEKMDGSLGILFNYAGQWIMATRGSFNSEQAKKGLEILEQKYNLRKFHHTIAYLCEIIYPENRIVVNYNEERIMFLSAVSEGRELNWSTANALFHSSGILDEDIVKTSMVNITENIFKHYKNLNEADKEGFVLRFHPSNYRVKIKFEEYVRLHRLLTNFSNIDIWECLRTGTDMVEYLSDVPDEFDNWVRGTMESLNTEFNTIELTTKRLLTGVLSKGFSSRKDLAEWVFSNISRDYAGLVLAMMDGKDINDTVWRMIRPSYQKPFWQTKP